MIEALDSDQIDLVAGGMDGLGPDMPPATPQFECPNLEAFRRWQLQNPFYGY